MAFWHHATGLVFGVLVFTFILSGLFSMNPWGLFASQGVSADDRVALHGPAEPLAPERLEVAWRRFEAAAPGFAARELRVFAFDGRWWLRFRNGRDAPRLMALEGDAPRAMLPASAVEAVAGRLAEGSLLRDRAWRDAPDRHYYNRRGEPVLPVLRLRLADEAGRWYYLDPATGSIAHKSDTTRRARRWWFNALHSLDFPWLLAHMPSWYAVIIGASLGGLLVSATGVVVGLRRARTALRRRAA